MRASLARLDLDYVDVFVAHRPDTLTPMEEVVRAFTQIVNERKALYWGPTEWTAYDVERAHHLAAVHHLIPHVCDQPQYNLFSRERVEKELAPIFCTYAYGLTIWPLLEQVMLTGKYNEGIPEGSRFTGVSLAAEDKQSAIDTGKQLATPEGQTKIKKVKALTAMAPAWCLAITM